MSIFFDPFYPLSDLDRYFDRRFNQFFGDNLFSPISGNQRGQQQQSGQRDTSQQQQLGDSSSTQLSQQQSGGSNAPSLFSRFSLSRAPPFRLDVSESPKEFLIKADLPGMNKENIHLHIEDDILTISGERQEEKKEENEVMHLVERDYGRISRSIRLPQNASSEDCSAHFENGTLLLKLGKKEQKETRKRIDIK